MYSVFSWCETIISIELIRNPKFSISWQGLKVDLSWCITTPIFDKSKVIFEMQSEQELCELLIVIK